MARKKDHQTKEAIPPQEPARELTDAEYEEFVTYLLTRNIDDMRITKQLVDCFIGSMNGEHIYELRDILEVYLKLDRHSGEFWTLKLKRTSN